MKISSLLLPLSLLYLVGCSPRYDYTLHKPKIVYPKPTKKALRTTMRQTLGRGYRWAEEGPRSFDCSGFVYYSYGRMNMEVPRMSADQSKAGYEISTDELQYGDLLFFDTTSNKSGAINHVGIYLGDGKFQHASNAKKGVIISSMSSSYYRDRLVVCKRYMVDDEINSKELTTTELSTLYDTL